WRKESRVIGGVATRGSGQVGWRGGRTSANHDGRAWIQLRRIAGYGFGVGSGKSDSRSGRITITGAVSSGIVCVVMRRTDRPVAGSGHALCRNGFGPTGSV